VQEFCESFIFGLQSRKEMEMIVSTAPFDERGIIRGEKESSKVAQTKN